MPEYYVSSHFLEHGDLDLGADPDGFFDVNALDFGDLNTDFAEDQVLEYPDEMAGDQNVLQINEHSNHDQGQADLPYGILHSRSEEWNEALDEREEVLDTRNVVSANVPASHEQPQGSLPNVEHRFQDAPKQFTENRGKSPGQDVPPHSSSLNFSQPQEDSANGGHHSQSESNESRESQQDLPSLQAPSSATDSFNFEDTDFGIPDPEPLPEFDLERYRLDGQDQASAGLPNGGQQSDDEFDFSDVLSGPANHTILDGSSRPPELVLDDEQRVKKRLRKAKQTGSSKPKHRRAPAQKRLSPKPQAGSITSTARPSIRPVRSGGDSGVNRLGIDPGYGTLNHFQNPTFGPFPVTPYQMGSAVQQSGFDNMHGGQSQAYSSQEPEEYDEDVAEVGEDIAESDPNFSPANDLNYYTEDPKTGVRESRRRKGWGRTGTRNGVEVWFNPETGEWQESASHHSYREILIGRAQAEHPDKIYLHPDKTDGLPHGETAFFLPHQNLGPDRDDCPDALFVWPPKSQPKPEPEGEEDAMKAQANKKRKPNTRPRGPDPGFWFEDGKILLDPHNNPVIKHPDMPLTLSSHTEGYKLNLMRVLNAGISQKDEWARMPRWIYGRVKKTGNFMTRYIGTPNTHVNMPSVRFREKKGTVAGQKRDGSDNIREGLKAVFAEYDFDPSISGSTRGFGRDLLPWERDLVKLKNKGMYPERAGETRALDGEAQNKDLQKMLKKIEKGRKQQAKAEAAKAGDASRKRPRNDFEEPSQDSDLLPPKRVYQEPGNITSNTGAARNNARMRSGDQPQKDRRRQGSPQTQRYGNHGVMPTLNQNTNTLEAGGRSHYGTFGTARPPQQNANTWGGYQQVPSMHDTQFMWNQDMPSYPSIGLENGANPDQLPQGYRGETWPAQALINNPYYQGVHYRQQHAGTQSHYPAGQHQLNGENAHYVRTPHQGNGHSTTQYNLGHLSDGNFHEAEPYQSPQNKTGGFQNVQVNNDRHKQAQQENESRPDAPQLQLPQGTSNAPIPIDDSDGETGSAGYALPQTLGKRVRLHSGRESQEDSLGPGGKRRRMPGTEGYNLLPGTHRRAEKKLRKSKRDEHVPPPVFNLGESGQTASPPQAAVAVGDVATVSIPNQAPKLADVPGRDPLRVPTPAPAGQIPDGDIRDMPPSSEWECLRLQIALDYTRWAYKQWTGTDAPQTNRRDSYNAQFGVMFNAFRQWWLSDRNPEQNEPVEWLVGLDPWEGTVADWKPPVTDGLFYECMRRGFYAPRKEDGSLLYPGYRHIYEDYPWYNPIDESQMSRR